jgi:hypothetical protein
MQFFFQSFFFFLSVPGSLPSSAEMTFPGEFRKKGASSRGMSDDSCPEDDDSPIPRHVTQERPQSHDLSGWSGSPVTPYEISNQTDAKRKAKDECAPKTARFKEDLFGLETSTQKVEINCKFV